MSTPTTTAPSSLNRSQVVAPMPPAAPVITETFPSSLFITSAGLPAPRSDFALRRPASCWFRREVDVLELGVVLERVRPELAPDARLLEAAERRGHPNRGVGVDRDHAALDRARHPQRLGAVARPDRAGEPVDRVVGQANRLLLVAERDHHRHRP